MKRLHVSLTLHGNRVKLGISTKHADPLMMNPPEQDALRASKGQRLPCQSHGRRSPREDTPVTQEGVEDVGGGEGPEGSRGREQKKSPELV